MKSMILSVKYSDSEVQVRVHLPEEFAGNDAPGIKDLKDGLEKELLNNITAATKWMEITASKQNSKLSLYVNDKILIAREPSPDVSVN